jgi:selenide,water dikinase
MTDVTGFGLLGHLYEVCCGSKLSANIAFDAIPILSSALHLAQAGYATGASERNWASLGGCVKLPPSAEAWQQKLLCDPQTSGGLLIACARECVAPVLEIFKQQGFQYAREIGSLMAGPPEIHVS